MTPQPTQTDLTYLRFLQPQLKPQGDNLQYMCLVA